MSFCRRFSKKTRRRPGRASRSLSHSRTADQRQPIARGRELDGRGETSLADHAPDRDARQREALEQFRRREDAFVRVRSGRYGTLLCLYASPCAEGTAAAARVSGAECGVVRGLRRVFGGRTNVTARPSSALKTSSYVATFSGRARVPSRWS